MTIAKKAYRKNLVEVEDDVDVSVTRHSRTAATVVSPRQPFVPVAAEVLSVQTEVSLTQLVVGQLAQSARQSAAADRAVVREVGEVHLGAATVALTSRV